MAGTHKIDLSTLTARDSQAGDRLVAIDDEDAPQLLSLIPGGGAMTLITTITTPAADTGVTTPGYDRASVGDASRIPLGSAGEYDLIALQFSLLPAGETGTHVVGLPMVLLPVEWARGLGRDDRSVYGWWTDASTYLSATLYRGEGDDMVIGQISSEINRPLRVYGIALRS